MNISEHFGTMITQQIIFRRLPSIPKTSAPNINGKYILDNEIITLTSWTLDLPVLSSIFDPKGDICIDFLFFSIHSSRALTKSHQKHIVLNSRALVASSVSRTWFMFFTIYLCFGGGSIAFWWWLVATFRSSPSGAKCFYIMRAVRFVWTVSLAIVGPHLLHSRGRYELYVYIYLGLCCRCYLYSIRARVLRKAQLLVRPLITWSLYACLFFSNVGIWESQTMCFWRVSISVRRALGRESPFDYIGGPTIRVYWKISYGRVDRFVIVIKRRRAIVLSGRAWNVCFFIVCGAFGKWSGAWEFKEFWNGSEIDVASCIITYLIELGQRLVCEVT